MHLSFQHPIRSQMNYAPRVGSDWKGKAWGLASTKVGGRRAKESVRFSSGSHGELYYGQKRGFNLDAPPEDPVSYLNRGGAGRGARSKEEELLMKASSHERTLSSCTLCASASCPSARDVAASTDESNGSHLAIVVTLRRVRSRRVERLREQLSLQSVKPRAPVAAPTLILIRPHRHPTPRRPTPHRHPTPRPRPPRRALLQARIQAPRVPILALRPPRIPRPAHHLGVAEAASPTIERVRVRRTMARGLRRRRARKATNAQERTRRRR
eukprot:scaffold35009_cov24-Tisochrysis_lutea.AAC.2